MVYFHQSFPSLELVSPQQVFTISLCGVFYFPWHRHQVEGTNGFYRLFRKTQAKWVNDVAQTSKRRRCFEPRSLRPKSRTHVYVRHNVCRNVAFTVAIAVCLLPVISATYSNGNPTTQPRLLRKAVTQPFSIDVSTAEC